jgi:hypothetical protein
LLKEPYLLNGDFMKLVILLSFLMSFSLCAACEVSSYTIDAVKVTLKSEIKEAKAYEILTQTLTEDPCLQYLFEEYYYNLREGSADLARYIYNDYFNGYTVEELLSEFLADL